MPQTNNTQGLFPGYRFWTLADGRKHGYRVVARVRCLPYHPTHGYAVALDDKGDCWSITAGPLRGVVQRQDLSARIGKHGATWYVKP